MIRMGRFQVFMWKRWAIASGVYPNFGIRPFFRFWRLGPVEVRWFFSWVSKRREGSQP